VGESPVPLRTLVASVGRSLTADVHALGRDRLLPAAALAGRLILLAAAVGVVAMHQLGGAPGRHSHDHGSAPARHAVLAAPDHCPQPAGADCPRVHGHPGQVCQPHQGGNGPDGVPALAPTPATPVEPPLLSARTAAHEAGDGTGCGPPRLAELSLRRI
jgi:hypothetical protein